MKTPVNKIGVADEKHLMLLTLSDYLQGRPVKDIERLLLQISPLPLK